ncbi:hypothetical protein A2U01_0071799, partial [Trifolium medium]|nr:hypothetical protein [Trifolium medium]
MFIPEWKWDGIAMDFVGGTLVLKLAEIYVEQIVKLHGIQVLFRIEIRDLLPDFGKACK